MLECTYACTAHFIHTRIHACMMQKFNAVPATSKYHMAKRTSH